MKVDRAAQLKWPKAIVTSALVCLFLSATLRLGTGFAMARSEEPEEVENTDAAEDSCQTNPDYIPILNALRSREAAANEREADLSERAEAIRKIELEVKSKLVELAVAEQQLRDTIALAQEASETDLSQLTQVYQSMKPKEASALFEKMAPEFAAGFLGRMAPDSAAEILAGLGTDHAYAISVILAGRNAEIPLE